MNISVYENKGRNLYTTQSEEQEDYQCDLGPRSRPVTLCYHSDYSLGNRNSVHV